MINNLFCACFLQDFVDDTYYNAVYKVSPADYQKLKNIAVLPGINPHDAYEVKFALQINTILKTHFS